MNPITNSPIKETIRQKHYNIANNIDANITNRLNNDCIAVQNEAQNRIRSITYKNRPSSGACFVLAIVTGIILAVMVGGTGFLLGLIIGVGIYAAWIFRIKKINSDLDASKIRIQCEADSRVQQLRYTAASQIRDAYNDADRKTRLEIDRYDEEVRRNCQIILNKPDAFEAMVDHVVGMFQRMVSHADSSSNKKFVETDFIYKVELYGICYKYQSTYSNPNDDFNFDKQRYRNLNTKEECEGLAQAIAKLTMRKMKSLYPPNSLNITVSHVDAEVVLHFKSANKNYVPPRDIY